eukprot:593261-Amorphochlora_amoeboformis.AAC.1
MERSRRNKFNRSCPQTAYWARAKPQKCSSSWKRENFSLLFSHRVLAWCCSRTGEEGFSFGASGRRIVEEEEVRIWVLGMRGGREVMKAEEIPESVLILYICVCSGEHGVGARKRGWWGVIRSISDGAVSLEDFKAEK